jgi:hypothetical protein
MSENNSKVNVFMNRLEALEQGVSTTSSIVGEVLTVQQTITEIKQNRTDFDKALKEAPKKEGIDNDAIKEDVSKKKLDSIWTVGDFGIVREPEVIPPP